MAETLKTVIGVFKLRIAVAIMFSAMAGVAVAPGEVPEAWRLVVLAVATILSAGAAGAFNQYAERDLDRRMPRTKGRPFATGAYSTGPFWLSIILVVLAVSVAMAVWALNLWVAIHLFLGAFVYGVVYTVWLKRRTAWNIVWGGLAGSFAVLAGASAVDPALSPAPIILALVLFLWTPPHFWSLATVLHKEYAAARVPMLPVVVGDARTAQITLCHTVALVALSLVPYWFGLGWIYLVCAAAGGVLFVERSIALVRDPGPGRASQNFRASLLQLTLLQLGAVLDRLILG